MAAGVDLAWMDSTRRASIGSHLLNSPETKEPTLFSNCGEIPPLCGMMTARRNVGIDSCRVGEMLRDPNNAISVPRPLLPVISTDRIWLLSIAARVYANVTTAAKGNATQGSLELLREKVVQQFGLLMYNQRRATSSCMPPLVGSRLQPERLGFRVIWSKTNRQAVR